MWNLSSVSIKGVLSGIGTNIVASFILSIVVAFVFVAATGISPENQNEFQQSFESSLNVRLSFLLGGLVIAFAMGLVSEWVASIRTLINATICGVLLTLFNAAFIFISPEAAPIWSQAIIIIGVVPSSIFGGWLIGYIKNT